MVQKLAETMKFETKSMTSNNKSISCLRKQNNVLMSVNDTGAAYFDQIGHELDAALADAARLAAAQLPHYRWLGGLPRPLTRQRIKRAHVLVNSSVMEGGAHVILEAVQSGTPVLASRISGNVGMLGADYAGYFNVGDAAGLAALVKRCATELGFLAHLQNQCALRAELFEPAVEKCHVLKLLASVIKESP